MGFISEFKSAYEKRRSARTTPTVSGAQHFPHPITPMGSKNVKVSEHTRSNGTKVRTHTRTITNQVARGKLNRNINTGGLYKTGSYETHITMDPKYHRTAIMRQVLANQQQNERPDHKQSPYLKTHGWGGVKGFKPIRTKSMNPNL